jgi:predicted nucleotidyltransferase
MNKPTQKDENLEKQLARVTQHTIYEVRHGSHAYGTNIATSDVDKKGICLIPDPALYFGGESFEQQDGGWTDALGNKEDKVVYHLPKFIELAAQCNPN